MYKYRWKPNSAQKAAYRQRCISIEEAKYAISNDVYDINCTGDCCTGDEIKFFNPAKYGEYLFGIIVSDSYGEAKQQHTFTVEVQGERMLIKGRNLYKNGVLRKKWLNEQDRTAAINEKHERGDIARENMIIRKSGV